MTAEPLPDGPLVAWYGDDFTGSAATMEVLAFAGLPSILFLDLPTPEELARFAHYRGIGIASVARSKSPEWMEEHLPPAFERLAAIRAPIAHYKICSTLDSAPHVGSIGRAIDLAAPILGRDWHPLLIAAPPINRFQAFGNLFASVGGVPYRLDRHPTMSRHPVTPMGEADVRLHLAKQTAKRFGLVDILALRSGRAGEAVATARSAGAEVIAIDTIDADDLAAAGSLIWRSRGERLFAIGSQGVEYALVAHLRAIGALPAEDLTPSAGRAERIVVVSGSCSPDTAAQIAHAAERGFVPIRLDPRAALDEIAWERALAESEAAALAAIARGADPIVFTASGPDDPAVAAFEEAAALAKADRGVVGEKVGAGLGRLLSRVLAMAKLRRGIVCGGDTSGYAATELGIRALTALAPTQPGAALCEAHFADPGRPVLEIALKGGQMGSPDYFHWIKEGGGPARERSKAA